MKIFTTDSIYEEAISFVREWVNLLSESKFQEAFLLLDINPGDRTHCIKNYEELRDIFLEYYSGVEEIVFTNIFSMDCTKERVDMYKYNDNTGFEVEYDLPINGEWSDFTAQFLFKKYNENEFFVYLKDVHIL